MAIVINNHKSVLTRSFSAAPVKSHVVPAASVWEPRSTRRGFGEVRTLGAEDRTRVSDNFVRSYSQERIYSVPEPGKSSSWLSNVILGGVFGLAVLFGTAVSGIGSAEGPAEVPPAVAGVDSVAAIAK